MIYAIERILSMLNAADLAVLHLAGRSFLRWAFVTKIRWLQFVRSEFPTDVLLSLFALLPILLHAVVKIISRIESCFPGLALLFLFCIPGAIFLRRIIWRHRSGCVLLGALFLLLR